MNKRFLNQYMMPLIIIGALLVFRLIGNQDDEGNEEDTNEGWNNGPGNSPAEPKPQPKEKNTFTWYYIGNKGGSIKKIQTRCNMLITMCKDAVKNGNVDDVDNSNSRERIKKIATWEKLKVDGSYGNKTGAFVQYVTGKNNTSLAVMRDKYTAFHQIIY
jgi:hypothetical protein